MAKSEWGRVYYQEFYAGILERMPDGSYKFSYDTEYLNKNLPAIAFSLPKQMEAFISKNKLHPFFDNLVAEGWLRNAQARALKLNPWDDLGLLLGFGYDLPGAVSIADPEPREHEILEHVDIITKTAIQSRASLSGVQHKLLLVKEGQNFRPVKGNELSTHIAKLPSENHKDIVELELLTTLTMQNLLPEDDIVKVEIDSIPSIGVEKALIVQRFDRTIKGKRLHFEEFNQLLGHASGDEKYEGSYEDMGRFILKTPGCITVEALKLYKRILAEFLTGNTDAHFKNFAMFHTGEGMRLTPAYDLVAASYYKQYHTIALRVAGSKDLEIGSLKPKHILNMGYEFGLSSELIEYTVNELKMRMDAAKDAVLKNDDVAIFIREKIANLMEKRWNSSFSLIGHYLSKKQKNDAKH